MEHLLKSKGIWKYMKTLIPYPSYDQSKFVIDGKKDEAIGVIKPISLGRYDFIQVELISLMLPRKILSHFLIK